MKKPVYKEREQDVVNAIIEYLRYKRFYAQRMNSGAISTKSGNMIRLAPIGTPDIMAFKVLAMGYCMMPHLGLFFFEVKVGNNKPTFFQKQKMIELESYGAKCYVVHSVSEVEKILG